MDDKKIVELYWQRSEEAITKTAEKYNTYLHSISHNILYNNEDVRECVNDTYFAAWNTIPPNAPIRLSTFLGKIVRNISINRYNLYKTKKRGNGQLEYVLSELDECIPDKANVIKNVEDKDITNIIQSFLYSQPKYKRYIFIHRYWYITPISDIAKNFNMSESKVTSLLFRMRKELKKILEGEGLFYE